MNEDPAAFRATVVVVLGGSAPLATRCLQAVAERTPPELYDVVVVDDASDGNAELLAALDGDVTVVRNPAPRGIGTARAQGAAAATGEVLVFLSPEVEVLDGWLPALLATLDDEPNAGLVAPVVLGDGADLVAAGVVTVARPDASPAVLLVPAGAGEPASGVVGRQQRDAVDVDCFAVLRTVYAEAGGFVEGYRTGLDVVDLCLTVMASGRSNLIVPEGQVRRLDDGQRPAPGVPDGRLFDERWADRYRAAFRLDDRRRVVTDPNRQARGPFDRARMREPQPRTPSAPTLGLVVGTYNEEALLAGALDSAPDVDDVLVADMESTDGTLDIARAHGARILHLPRAGIVEPGRQPSIDASTAEWVLILDADERLSAGGVDALRRLIAHTPGTVGGYLLPYRTWIGDREIRSTGWDAQYELHPRLLRRSGVTWSPAIHSVPEVRGELAMLPPEVGVSVDHLNFADVHAAFDTFNRYSTREAHERIGSGARSTVSQGLHDGVAEFMRRYNPDVDGDTSLVMSMGLLMYKFLNHAKAVEASGWDTDLALPSRDVMNAAWQAFLDTLDGQYPAATASAAGRDTGQRRVRINVDARTHPSG